jgi:hypothetical protein
MDRSGDLGCRGRALAGSFPDPRRVEVRSKPRWRCRERRCRPSCCSCDCSKTARRWRHNVQLSWESARCCSPVRNSFSFHFRRRRRDGGDTGGFAISAATSDSLQRNARPILIGRSGQVPLLSLFRIVLGGTFRRQDTSLMSINLSIIRFQRRQTVPGVSIEGGSLAKWGYIAQLDPPCNADSCCIAIAIHV